jgi:phage terminase small subunit
MNERWERFAAEYLIDLNGAAAYRRVYPKCRGDQSAEAGASRLLRNDKVRALVEAGMAGRAQRTEIRADNVLREIGLVGFSDVTAFVVDDDGGLRVRDGIDASALRAVASFKRRVRRVRSASLRVGAEQVPAVVEDVEVEVRLWPKVSALELACRHLGLLKDKTPLDELLGSLPPEFGAEVRAALARVLAGGGPAAGGGVPPPPPA